MIHSATFSIYCIHFASFCQTDLKNFVPLLFPTCCVFGCNFLASRLNLTSSATFSNCCNLFLQISIGYIPFCRTDQLRYLFHILYMFCIYYIDKNGKKVYSALCKLPNLHLDFSNCHIGHYFRYFFNLLCSFSSYFLICAIADIFSATFSI